MKKSVIRTLAFTMAVSGIGVTACANKASDCEFVNQCANSAGAGGTAGSDSGGASNGGGVNAGGTTKGGSSGSSTVATCDTSKTPSAESCLVGDKYAVFVSSTGDDGAVGTKDRPVKTIAKALSLATTKKSVVACSGTYTDALAITAGAKIYGSFDCSNDWRYDKTKPTVVAPTVTGPALSVTSVSAKVVIEDVQFKSVDATEASGSSIAVFVKESSNVTLRRVSLTAGNGAAGVTPAISPYTFADVTTLAGNAGTATTGGAAVVCTCSASSTTRGGSGGAQDQGGQLGTPTYDASSGLGGNPLVGCGSGGSGIDGVGAPAALFAFGATTLGSFTNDTWTPASGIVGQDGQPGQGGGGGAGKATGGGGSGACGGCGGKGGPAGNGGGASIALLSVNSNVSLEASTLTTGNGGTGSDGAAGQIGQEGGGRGKGYGTTATAGCDGGNGGSGAAGATGGGGAGGLSVGIFYSGTIPAADSDTKTTLGQPGLGGKGGDNVATTDDGITGTAANTLAIP